MEIVQPEEPGEGELPKVPTDNDGRDGNNDTIAHYPLPKKAIALVGKIFH